MIGPRSRNGSAPTLGGGGRPDAPDAPVRRTPLPSALDGRAYRIVSSGAPGAPAWVERASATEGRMRVPTDDSPAAARVRLHEMAHVRWSPDRNSPPPGVSPMTLNAVEDRRCHKRLHEIGMGDRLSPPLWERGGSEWQALERKIDELPALELGRLVAASDMTAEAAPLRRMLAEHGKGWIAAVVDSCMREAGLDGRRPAYQRAVEGAAALEAALGSDDEGDDPQLDEGMLDQLDGRFSEYGDPPGEWGKAHFTSARLTEPLPSRMRRRTRRPCETGAVPRNWHRIPVDGRVFDERRKRPGGGTVLVDLSGSMSLSMDEVDELLGQFPAVTVAVYAGTEGSFRVDGVTYNGTVKVIARKGRRCSRDDVGFPYGGNVIDGPALDWLGTQSGPLVWVSDGCVTGKGETWSPNLVVDAALKCRRYGIQRVDRFGVLVGAPEA